MEGFRTSTVAESRIRPFRLGAMLADPIVQAVMACDRVSEDEVADALDRARANLASRRPGAPTAGLSEPDARRPQWRR